MYVLSIECECVFKRIGHCEWENNFIKIMRAKIFTAQYPIKKNMSKLRILNATKIRRRRSEKIAIYKYILCSLFDLIVCVVVFAGILADCVDCEFI